MFRCQHWPNAVRYISFVSIYPYQSLRQNTKRSCAPNEARLVIHSRNPDRRDSWTPFRGCQAMQTRSGLRFWDALLTTPKIIRAKPARTRHTSSKSTHRTAAGTDICTFYSFRRSVKSALFKSFTPSTSLLFLLFHSPRHNILINAIHPTNTHRRNHVSVTPVEPISMTTLVYGCTLKLLCAIAGCNLLR